MTHTIDLRPRLRLAAQALIEKGWTTGTERNSAGQMCLTGAVRYCAPQNGDEYIIREVLRKRDRAEGWNDSRADGAEEVIGYLQSADITDEDLAETFGPQWLEIVGLVRAISSLETPQISRLGAAWGAARGAARGAAWDAARGAAVRDLIGQYGFTQEHYDLLTGPWRKTIGKIHPDDLDIYEADDFGGRS